MTLVVFAPAGARVEVPEGTSVLAAARRAGVDLDSVCGGRGVCGRCQVIPTPGAVGPWSATELAYVARRGPLAPGRRLGCAVAVGVDVTIDVPPDSQVHRPVVRKDLDAVPLLRDLRIDPTVHLAYLEVAVDDGTAVDTVVRDALADRHPDLGPTPLAVLLALPAAVATGALTVAVRTDGVRPPHLAAVWPGFQDRALGIAFDVGSTTVAGHLCDLGTGAVLASAGRMNPQIRFGEDLMSRVSYAMQHGPAPLTTAVREALDHLAAALLSGVAARPDEVLEVVVVGNPVMHHLLLGLDPTPLGMAPFTPAVADPVRLPAAALDLGLAWAEVETGPLLAGHVGADTAAAVLAEGPHRAEGTRVLVDVGTNAEIVVGDRHGLWAASSPTGPAFEGAQLSCGQRATVGAIERVRIDPVTLEPRVKVIGCDPWSDEPGFAEASAGVPIAGVCGSGIVDAIAELFLAGVIDADGTIDGTARTPRVVPDGRTFSYVLFERGDVRLCVTQHDVRAIQLAKAALRAGIELLLDEAGRPEVHEVLLAGAFGAHLDPLRTLVLGLVPDVSVARVRAVGNSAGVGALQALLSRTERTEMATTARRIRKVETAIEPRFQEHFVAAMAFPHASAPTPHLDAVVTMPERRSVRRPGGAAARARRRGSPRAAD
jgi:uncharacterized 2Fe-2S/4Fe-4S cluster protein (DUF4445 family)